MHQLCRRCHGTPPPAYRTAPRLTACGDCHGPNPESVYLVGDNHRLTLSVRVTGPFSEPGDLGERLARQCEEDDLTLVESSEAASRLDLHFHLAEVHDRLVPADSGERLFQGSCALCLRHGDAVLLDLTFRSKVIRARDAAAAGRVIGDFLRKRAYWLASAVLQSLVFEEPRPDPLPGRLPPGRYYRGSR